MQRWKQGKHIYSSKEVQYDLRGLVNFVIFDLIDFPLITRYDYEISLMFRVLQSFLSCLLISFVL